MTFGLNHTLELLKTSGSHKSQTIGSHRWIESYGQYYIPPKKNWCSLIMAKASVAVVLLLSDILLWCSSKPSFLLGWSSKLKLGFSLATTEKNKQEWNDTVGLSKMILCILYYIVIYKLDIDLDFGYCHIVIWNKCLFQLFRFFKAALQ